SRTCREMFESRLLTRRAAALASFLSKRTIAKCEDLIDNGPSPEHFRLEISRTSRIPSSGSRLRVLSLCEDHRPLNCCRRTSPIQHRKNAATLRLFAVGAAH